MLPRIRKEEDLICNHDVMDFTSCKFCSTFWFIWWMMLYYVFCLVLFSSFWTCINDLLVELQLTLEIIVMDMLDSGYFLIGLNLIRILLMLRWGYRYINQRSPIGRMYLLQLELTVKKFMLLMNQVSSFMPIFKIYVWIVF